MTKTKSKAAAKKKPSKPAAATKKTASSKKAATKKAPTKPAAKSAAKPAAKKVTAKPASSRKPVAAKRPARKLAAAMPSAIAAAPIVAEATAKPAIVEKAPVAAAPAAPARERAAKAPRAVVAAPAPAPTHEVLDGDAAEVAAFLRDCDHPRVADYEQVRKLILEANSSIEEGIKWAAPSFRTTDWFATFHMRDPQKVQIVFHLGAKKSEGTQRVPVGAPEGMVEWLAPDRCMVTVEDVKRRGKALQAFVRAWILHV
jgi:hypothetical protein